MKKIWFLLFSTIFILAGCSNVPKSTEIPSPTPPVVEKPIFTFSKESQVLPSSDGSKIAYLNGKTLSIYDTKSEESKEIAQKVSHFQWFKNELFFIRETDPIKEVNVNVLQKTDGITNTDVVKAELMESDNAFRSPQTFEINDDGNVLLTMRIGFFESEYWDVTLLTDTTFVGADDEEKAMAVTFSYPTWSGDGKTAYFISGPDNYEYYRNKIMIFKDQTFKLMDSLLLDRNAEWESVDKIEVNAALTKAIVKETIIDPETEEEQVVVFQSDLQSGERTIFENVTDFEVHNNLFIFEQKTDTEQNLFIIKDGEKVREMDGSNPVIYDDKLLYLNKDYQTIEEVDLSAL